MKERKIGLSPFFPPPSMIPVSFCRSHFPNRVGLAEFLHFLPEQEVSL